MNKVLFLAEDWPLTPDATGGAAALNYSHLELLAKLHLQIHLAILARDPDARHFYNSFVEKQPKRWQQVCDWTESQEFIHLAKTPRQSNRIQHFIKALLDPYYLISNFNQGVISKFTEVLNKFQPDLIWAEHLVPAVLASKTSSTIPVIYSHHDWLWRIKQHRQNSQQTSLNQRVQFALRRRGEERLVRRVRGVVSGSALELEQIRVLGAEHIAYLPTTYAPVEMLNNPIPLEEARIVHLGGMDTTANRVGLQRFMEITWPLLCQELAQPPELLIVGSLQGINDQLTHLLQEGHATCVGFVEDLSSVMRPFDIHILPWEHSTGTRTRIPLVLSYGQVLVSHAAAAACAPELRSGKDCILVPDLIQMSDAIVGLLNDLNHRREIGLTARQTFLTSFTNEALQPRLATFLDQTTL